MLENIYEGENALSEVYLSKEYFCEMYQTCVSSKLCEFISSEIATVQLLLCDCFCAIVAMLLFLCNC